MRQRRLCSGLERHAAAAAHFPGRVSGEDRAEPVFEPLPLEHGPAAQRPGAAGAGGTGRHSLEQALEQAELGRLLDKFLRSLPQKDCCIFLRSYWYMDPLEEIARRYRMPLGSVKSSLHRSRKKLRTYLEQKGVIR